jgi:hypothetical protein
MNQFPQWGPTAVIVGGYLIGLYFQTRQIESLGSEMNAKFEGLRAEMNARFDAAREALFRVERAFSTRG